MPQQPMHQEQEILERERWELLRQIDDLTEQPLIALSLVWLMLLIIDFISGLSRTLQLVSYVIWALFIIDFLLEFTIAPRKLAYLRRNWLTAVSLMLPALRVLRIFRAMRVLRAARATRSVGLVRLVGSLNRGMRAVSAALGSRGVGYVVVFTLIVIFVGGAGMYYFESPAALRQAGYVEQASAGEGFRTYGDAVWWTAMIMTTLGSDRWPVTAEGRLLCWLLALYAFAIFGYITATIASFFVGRDRLGAPAEAAAAPTADLEARLAELQAQLALLNQRLEAQPSSQAGEHRGQ